MATSGTYLFNPSLGELTLYAFFMIGVRPTALTQEHMESARMAANLLNMDWSARQGANLWEVTPTTVPFVQGQASYSVPGNVVAIYDLYVTIGNSGSFTDRYIMPISRTEYSTYANKSQQGFPSVYWFDRLINGNITFWLVPDGNEVSFTYYSSSQIQDANFTSGQTVDIPAYFLLAYATGLARWLSLTWAPEREARMEAISEKAYATAAAQNVEEANFYISPNISSYYRT